MAEVTDGDRERAVALWNQAIEVHQLGEGWTVIAAALAEEREKARAPFLAVMRKIPPDSPELRWVADQIQRAAEENA